MIIGRTIVLITENGASIRMRISAEIVLNYFALIIGWQVKPLDVFKKDWLNASLISKRLFLRVGRRPPTEYLWVNAVEPMVSWKLKIKSKHLTITM